MIVKPKTLESWIKFIRFHPDRAERYMDQFWESQLRSKENLINVLYLNRPIGNIFIFGGWYGMLSQLILDAHEVRKIYTIDIDPDCEWVVNDVIKSDKVIAVTDSMSVYNYPEKPACVINTVTEHITQSQYDMWWDNVPKGTFYILQGNNFWDMSDHIRCASSLDDFTEMNNCQNILGRKLWPCEGPSKEFTRYMVWGYK